MQRLATAEEMHLKESIECYGKEFETDTSGMVEAVVSPRSQFSGRSMGKNNFNDRFRVTPLSIHRQENVYKANLDDILLKTGDVICF